MRAGDHDRLHEWAGAYTMGALEPDDRREFETHLRTCRDCQVEVGRLAALPGLLGRIEPDALDDVPDAAIAAAIEGRVRTEIVGLVASRRRWRWLTAAAVATLVAVVVGVMWPTGRDHAVELAIGETTAQAASIRAEAKGWGTELRAEIDGLPVRDGYQLWTVDTDGAWTVAATWGPTPTRGAMVTGASSTAFGDISRIVVTSEDRADVIVDATIDD